MEDYRDFYKDVTSGTKKVFVKRAKRKSIYNETEETKDSSLRHSCPLGNHYAASNKNPESR